MLETDVKTLIKKSKQIELDVQDDEEPNAIWVSNQDDTRVKRILVDNTVGDIFIDEYNLSAKELKEHLNKNNLLEADEFYAIQSIPYDPFESKEYNESYFDGLNELKDILKY